MPGVPSGLGCDACRKQKKRCDLKKPSCSACVKRGVPCVGNGVKRWKFMINSQSPEGEEAVVAVRRPPRPRRPPSNETTRTASALVYMLGVQDVKYDARSFGGQFMAELPSRLGTSPLLDASIATVVASYNALHHPEKRAKAYVKYGSTLEALRRAMQGNAESTPVKMYTIVLIGFCQDWIDPMNKETAPHREMMIYLLRGAFREGKMDEFDRAYIYPLCQALVWEAYINPKIDLMDWFWGVLNFSAGPRPVVYNKEQPFLSLDVETQAQTALYFRDPQRYLHQIRRVYGITMAEKSRIRLLVDQLTAVALLPTKDEGEKKDRVTARVAFQVGHGMMMLLASALNRVLRRFDQDPALVEDMNEMCEEVIQMSATCVGIRPIGSHFVTKALKLVWAGLPDEDQHNHERLEAWMRYFQSDFEGADYIREARGTRRLLDIASSGSHPMSIT